MWDFCIYIYMHVYCILQWDLYYIDYTIFSTVYLSNFWTYTYKHSVTSKWLQVCSWNRCLVYGNQSLLGTYKMQSPECSNQDSIIRSPRPSFLTWRQTPIHYELTDQIPLWATQKPVDQYMQHGFSDKHRSKR